MRVATDDRAKSQTRRLTSGVVTSLMTRGAGMAVPVILIPLTYRYFGPTQYAAWATIVATTSMFLWADLGLGNGLLTKLTPLLAAGDLGTARRLVSGAYVVLGTFALVMVGMLTLSMPVVPWEAFLGLKQAELVRVTVLVVLGMMLINVPLSLVQRVQYAAGEVAISNLVQLIGPGSALLFALVGVTLEWPSLSVIALIAAGPLVANLVASTMFYIRTPELCPRPSEARIATTVPLLTMGLAFLFIQLCSSLAMNVDPVIAAHVVGASEMDDFSVSVRVFLLLGGLLTVMTLPLWPATAEALTRGDVLWVRRATWRMSALGSIGVLSCGVAIVASTPFLQLLLGSEYQPDRRLMLGLVAFWTIVAATSPLFMVQNSIGNLGPQLLAWPIFLTTTWVSKFLAAEAWGLHVIPIVGAAMYACVLVPAAIRGYRSALLMVPSREPQKGGVSSR